MAFSEISSGGRSDMEKIAAMERDEKGKERLEPEDKQEKKLLEQAKEHWKRVKDFVREFNSLMDEMGTPDKKVAVDEQEEMEKRGLVVVGNRAMEGLTDNSQGAEGVDAKAEVEKTMGEIDSRLDSVLDDMQANELPPDSENIKSVGRPGKEGADVSQEMRVLATRRNLVEKLTAYMHVQEMGKEVGLDVKETLKNIKEEIGRYRGEMKALGADTSIKKSEFMPGGKKLEKPLDFTDGGREVDPGKDFPPVEKQPPEERAGVFQQLEKQTDQVGEQVEVMEKNMDAIHAESEVEMRAQEKDNDSRTAEAASGKTPAGERQSSPQAENVTGKPEERGEEQGERMREFLKREYGMKMDEGPQEMDDLEKGDVGHTPLEQMTEQEGEMVRAERDTVAEPEQQQEKKEKELDEKLEEKESREGKPLEKEEEETVRKEVIGGMNEEVVASKEQAADGSHDQEVTDEAGEDGSELTQESMEDGEADSEETAEKLQSSESSDEQRERRLERKAMLMVRQMLIRSGIVDSFDQLRTLATGKGVENDIMHPGAQHQFLAGLDELEDLVSGRKEELNMDDTLYGLRNVATGIKYLGKGPLEDVRQLDEGQEKMIIHTEHALEEIGGKCEMIGESLLNVYGDSLRDFQIYIDRISDLVREKHEDLRTLRYSIHRR